jgi:hypothetical protein
MLIYFSLFLIIEFYSFFPYLPFSGVSDIDREAHGFEELSCEELGGSRNSRLNIDHLLGQDRDTDSESHDRRAHVVRQGQLFPSRLL